MSLVQGPAKETDPEGKIPPFCIDKTEVTQEAYFSYARANGITIDDRLTVEVRIDRKFIGKKKPMIFVSWEDANAYCRANGKRLVSGAEWEKAARGKDGCAYGTSACDSLTDKDHKPLANYWHDNLPGDRPDDVHVLVDVASYPAGHNGLFDMPGNVWEWVSDSGFWGKVIRGGSWRQLQ